ncbi:putative ABC transporter, ATP-binding protein [Desulfonema limicola]|uniref:ABC transporter, ATP-binding protein n=1 Tax=Desulfonema limicola TaxID=45656 RepID=A0A975B3W1_9BACT|nr:ABC transporter ATP-binding protein [Desulfonema limicola]QTA78303.1 putative ABC transporter, ATP-binding protein [Desulfonema limicola]
MGDIIIRNLAKEYVNHRILPRVKLNKGAASGDRVLVLDSIDLDFKDGELVCLLGPSGCGKSTLLRILAGFEFYSGFISIDGKQVQGPSPDHIFVFQHNALLPWMTVRENVSLGIRHLKKKQRNARIREYIEMVELEGFEDHYPHHLSGGMLRRAELARALVVNPETLFMDEPFTGLDFLAHMKMREEVVNMHEFIGKTIIMVTHDIDDALIMGDRIVILSGRPAHVKLTQKLDFSRPRDFRNQPELNKLRNEIFLMLGVNYAV